MFSLMLIFTVIDLSDKKLQNRVYIYVRSFRKATIYRLCLKKSKDLWKANSIPYHFADWRKFSFLEMEGPIFKKQEYNSKLKVVWWGVDKLLFFQKIGGVDFRHNLSKRIRIFTEKSRNYEEKAFEIKQKISLKSKKRKDIKKTYTY
ncbi:hypothetical protein BpHYR1_048252 [Brachionus plicatilis]|uniref:Uncharacterized protein n=1 Tax=Brachionus plicatilis TaxID=10195 RepID=A0A3M7RMA0_BRAPC|nr:hypothetical protein BpHYR1_048252 [Brachionus plicatilis]